MLGVSCTCNTSDRGSAGDVASYFGADFLTSVPSRWVGRVTEVHGLATGSNPLLLAAALASLRELHDGTAGTLVDQLGTPWPQVLMVEFRAPTGRIVQGLDGSVSCGFRCGFMHLQQP